MATMDLATLTQWITPAALEHGAHLPQHLMLTLGISRSAALARLRKLVDLQWLLREGKGRQATWHPGPLRQVVQRYSLAGLNEDLPWRRDFAPCFDLPPQVRRMAQHAFTELLNNAVDHSGGTLVTVSMRQTATQVQLRVADDGCGLFDRLADSFELYDPPLAMLELSKGKLSSSADRHSGHGLFFTSRLADVFDLHANASAFQSCAWDSRPWRARQPTQREGTAVYLAILLDTRRTLDAVLLAHSQDNAGYDFSRTRVPLHLIGGGSARNDGVLASRADARRAALRLQSFRQAELDFAGIGEVGHGFADELFRVIARANPQVQLQALHMNARVAAMINSVRSLSV